MHSRKLAPLPPPASRQEAQPLWDDSPRPEVLPLVSLPEAAQLAHESRAADQVRPAGQPLLSAA